MPIAVKFGVRMRPRVVDNNAPKATLNETRNKRPTTPHSNKGFSTDGRKLRAKIITRTGPPELTSIAGADVRCARKCDADILFDDRSRGKIHADPRCAVKPK